MSINLFASGEMAVMQPWKPSRVGHMLLIILGVCASTALSGNVGREFVFAPMPSYNTDYLRSTGVVLQAVSDSEDIYVNVSVPGISYDVNFLLPSDSGSYNFLLPYSLLGIDRNISTVVITSDSDIIVLSYTMTISSSDVFSVMPKQNLGQEYFLATMTWENKPASARDDCFGIILISALEQPTSLEIFPQSTVEFENEWFYAGDIILYTLRPYETIQILTEFINITGSRVLANDSVAVTVGSNCVQIPSDVYSWDLIAEQLAPFTTWGKSFVITPFATRTSGYIIHIVGGRDNTSVSYNGEMMGPKLNMGDYWTYPMYHQTTLVITADRPISIMQYSKGGDSGRRANGDPAMMRVVPIEQYVTKATFPVEEFPSNVTNVRDNYLRITSRCEYIKYINFWNNNIPFTPLWTEYYTHDFSYGTKYCSRWTKVGPGKYTIQSECIVFDDGREVYPKFSAAVYGTSEYSYESYLYRAAFDDETLTCLDYSENSTTGERDCDDLSTPTAVTMEAYSTSASASPSLCSQFMNSTTVIPTTKVTTEELTTEELTTESSAPSKNDGQFRGLVSALSALFMYVIAT